MRGGRQAAQVQHADSAGHCAETSPAPPGAERGAASIGQAPLRCTPGTTRRPVPLEHSLYYGGQLFTIARADQYLMQAGQGGLGLHVLGWGFLRVTGDDQ